MYCCIINSISGKEALRVKGKRKWIKWLLLLVAIAAIAGAAVYFGMQTESAEYTETTATEGSLTTYYNFDGLVHAPRMQTIQSSEAGIVRSVYVAQNQKVKKGDRLYRLDGGETVKADIDGEVTSLFIAEDDVVAAGETIAQIIDMSQLEVRLDVDEYDVRAVEPGAEVSVTVLATDTTFDGVVAAIDKNGTASGDLSYYTATVPMGGTEGAYPGMQVSAKVLREHIDNAVLLRIDAVQFDEYNLPYVEVADANGKPQRVDVAIGMSDGVYCQIVSGVSAGDTVLAPTGMSMMELMLQLDAKTR